MTGQRFGYLEVLKEEKERDKSGHIMWTCKCWNCGKIYSASGTNLGRKHTRSCGCLASEQMKRIRYDSTIDLIGQRFGKLTVLKKHLKRNKGGSNVHWLCLCDCGNKKVIGGNALRRGLTKTCGCVGHRKIYFKPGDKVGRLVILDMVSKKREGTKYKCKCDCGTIKIVSQNSLVTEETKSCGCLNREATLKRSRILPLEAYKIKKGWIRRTKYLTDGYIKGVISNTNSIKIKEITPEMIEAKRGQIVLHRQLQTLKQEVKNGTTGN